MGPPKWVKKTKMVLVRQYAIKYLSNPELKSVLEYFKCDFNKKITLGRFIKNLSYNPRNQDETMNKNIQLLRGLCYTNPYILNKYITELKWN